MADEFLIRIRAEDDATAAVKKITGTLSKVTAPIEKAQKRLGRLGDIGNSKLGKVAAGFGNVTSKAGAFLDKIAQIVPGLTAIGSAASLAGLSALANRFGAFGFNLNQSANLLGMNAQDLAAWQVAAKRAGVSAEEFNSSMSSSQMAIRGAAFGADPHAMTVLAKMGVQIKRNNDGSIDYLTTQQRIMEALRAQKSVAGQREAANALGMGALLPMIQQGSWSEDKARALRKGLVPSPEEVARGKAFKQDVNDLQDSVLGLGNAIGSALIPVLDPVVQGISKWLDGRRAKIADQIADAVQKFVDWLSRIDWDGVTGKIDRFFTAMGGVKGVAIAIAALTFASPIAGVLSLIAQLGTLTMTTIPAAVAALGTLGAAGTVAWLALHSEDLNGNEDEDLRRRRQAEGKGWDGDPVGQARAAANRPDATVSDRERYLFQRFKAAGYTDAQAAGQIGSLLQENGTLDPTTVNKKSGAAGIAQWLGPRARDFEKMFGHSVAKGTLGEQADFYLWEMKNSESKADKYIRMAKDPVKAAEIHAWEFERPGVDEANIDRRKANAERIYAQYGNGKINQSDSADAVAPVPSTGSGDQAVPDDHESRVASMQQSAATALHVTFSNVPQGARVEAKTSDGGYLPTKVNYAVSSDLGAMP